MQITRTTHAELIRHMRQAMVTGMSKERAKLYAKAMERNNIDTAHLTVR